jgi:hypothetical protein
VLENDVRRPKGVWPEKTRKFDLNHYPKIFRRINFIFCHPSFSSEQFTDSSKLRNCLSVLDSFVFLSKLDLLRCQKCFFQTVTNVIVNKKKFSSLDNRQIIFFKITNHFIKYYFSSLETSPFYTQFFQNLVKIFSFS